VRDDRNAVLFCTILLPSCHLLVCTILATCSKASGKTISPVAFRAADYTSTRCSARRMCICIAWCSTACDMHPRSTSRLIVDGSFRDRAPLSFGLDRRSKQKQGYLRDTYYLCNDSSNNCLDLCHYIVLTHSGSSKFAPFFKFLTKLKQVKYICCLKVNTSIKYCITI